MATIFITGSADGLGLLAARQLVALGHKVVLHARNKARGAQAIEAVPGAAAVLTGDLSSVEETKALAEAANVMGTFDAVIHNAGVYRVPAKALLSVNTLAPYILTCRMHPPQRLIYLSSNMHESGRPRLEAFTGNSNQINYSDTKLHVVMLAKAVARKWPRVYANAVNPGWVPTKMGGRGAPDDLQKGYETQVWLATSSAAQVTGGYFHHLKQRRYNPAADDVELQERLLNICKEVTGVAFPE